MTIRYKDIKSDCPYCHKPLDNRGYLLHVASCAKRNTFAAINLSKRDWEIVQNLLYAQLKNNRSLNEILETNDFEDPRLDELDAIADRMMIAIGWDGHK